MIHDRHVKIFNTTILSLSLVILSLSPVLAIKQSSESQENNTRENQFVPQQVIIKFKDSASANDNFKNNYNLKSLNKVLGQHKLKGSTKANADKFGLDRIYVAETNDADTLKNVKKLNIDPRVEYVEPNYIVSAAVTPNDPEFSKLWGLHNTGQTAGTANADINATEAWDVNQNSNLTVGIIDTGVDFTHPDLVANMWTNPYEIPANSIDDDGNGFVDDIHGYDFVNNDGDPFDDHGHGTHVAGTIGAVGNNGVGVVGVNWQASMAGIKFLSATGSGTTDNAIKSVLYANAMGFKITNNSWGGGGFSQALLEAISASNDQGSLFVAAAGNSNANTDSIPSYPAGYNVPNIISVAATDHKDARASFSNYGTTTVDLGAPGVSIYSTVPTGTCALCNSIGYSSLNGTSMASPHVAGAASLIWAANPELTSQLLKDKILYTSDVVSGMQGMVATSGRLNIGNAFETDSIAPHPFSIVSE